MLKKSVISSGMVLTIFMRMAILWADQGLDLNSECQDFVAFGKANGNQFGRDVTTGDLNNDGFPDLVVGAPLADTVYVLYGPLSSTGSVDLSIEVADVTILGKKPGSFTGESLAVADVNGDSKDDLIIGAPLASSQRPPYEPNCFNHGEVYVLYGGTLAANINLAQLQPDVTIIGRDCGDHMADLNGLGTGDVNNDGISDILIGAWNANHPNPPWHCAGFREGEAYVIYGNANLPAVINLSLVTADIEVIGDNGSALGSAMASGDVNSDGITDIILGAYFGWGTPPVPFGFPPQNAGRVYVIYGSGNFPAKHKIDLCRQAVDLTIINNTNSEQMGFSLASGDVNGDGVDDIITGAAPTSLITVLTGKVYVVYGSLNFPALHTIDFRLTAPDIEIRGQAIGDDFGHDVAVADFDSDGFADILIGARHADIGARIDAGIAHLIYGSDSFPPGHIIQDEDDAEAFIMLGGNSGDEVGWSVAIGAVTERPSLILGAPGFIGGGPGKVHAVVRAIDCDCADEAIVEAQNLVDEECDPCADWKNHGEYVNCVTKAVRKLIDEDRLTDSCKGTITNQAANSDIGKKKGKDCP